jgi:hypothetical protein
VALLTESLSRIQLSRPGSLAERRAALTASLGQSLLDAQAAGILNSTYPIEPLLEELIDDPTRR